MSCYLNIVPRIVYRFSLFLCIPFYIIIIMEQAIKKHTLQCNIHELINSLCMNKKKKRDAENDY